MTPRRQNCVPAQDLQTAGPWTELVGDSEHVGQVQPRCEAHTLELQVSVVHSHWSRFIEILCINIQGVPKKMGICVKGCFEGFRSFKSKNVREQTPIKIQLSLGEKIGDMNHD